MQFRHEVKQEISRQDMVVLRHWLGAALRTGPSSTAFYDAQAVTIEPCIREVKWDAYLPDVIRNAVQLPERRSGAYSKYAACRMYD